MCPLGLIPLFPQPRDIARKCRGVARNIDDPLRTHLCHCFDHILAHALSRGVDDDHIRFDAVVRELNGGLSRVGAEKFSICDFISPGILLCVVNRRIHNFHAIDRLHVPRKTQRDCSAAAV